MEDCGLEACPDNVGSSRQSGGHSEALSLKKQKQKQNTFRFILFGETSAV